MWGGLIVFSSFDPRDDIRGQIATEKDIDNDNVDEYVISVTDNWNDTVEIPLLFPAEARTGDMAEMPFIEMVLVNQPATTRNVGGDVKYQEAYIDFNIYYANTDNISAGTFGRKVADELVNLITTNRSSVSDTYFIEVINNGRELFEHDSSGKIVVFHRILEVRVDNYDV